MIRFLYISCLFFFFSLLLSCTSKSKIPIDEILIGVKVEDGYFASDENEDIVVNNQNYWIHWKAKYRNGHLDSLTRFYPEGAILYALNELKNDTTIYVNLKIPINQNWTITDSHLFENGLISEIELERLDKNYYLEKDRDRIFVVK